MEVLKIDVLVLFLITHGLILLCDAITQYLRMAKLKAQKLFIS
jgi:hypothetical protein